MHFLKAYLAAGSDRGIFVNFPMDFRGVVKASGSQWRLAVKAAPRNPADETQMTIELAPNGEDKPARTALWVRVPGWAAETVITEANGAAVKAVPDGGCLRLEREFKAGDRLTVRYRSQLVAEARRFRPVQLQPGRRTVLNDVSIIAGPDMLFAAANGTGRLTLLATVDDTGRLSFPARADGCLFTVSLPSADSTDTDILAALDSGKAIALRPWPELPARKRAAFAHNLLVVPANLVSAQTAAGFLRRAQDSARDSSLNEPQF